MRKNVIFKAECWKWVGLYKLMSWDLLSYKEQDMKKCWHGEGRSGRASSGKKQSEKIVWNCKKRHPHFPSALATPNNPLAAPTPPRSVSAVKSKGRIPNRFGWRRAALLNNIPTCSTLQSQCRE